MRWGIAAGLWCIAGMASAADGIRASFNDDATQLRIDYPVSMQLLARDTPDAGVHMVPALRLDACHWANDTRLVCTPAASPKDATPFRITLAPELRRTATGDVLRDTPLVAETRRPQLSARIETWLDGRPSIVVSAARGTPTASIVASLRLSVDGKPMPVTLGKRAKASNWSPDYYALKLPKPAAESVVLLSVVPGLVSPEGPLRGTQDGALVHVVDGEPFQVRGAACAGEDAAITAPVRDGRIDLAGCVPRESVRVFLSRAPAAGAIKGWGKQLGAGARIVDEGTEWRPYRGTGPARATGYWVELRLDAPSTTLDVALPPIADKSGASTAALLLRVGNGHPRPALFGAQRQAVLVPGAALPVAAINLHAQRVDTLAIARDARHVDATTPTAGDAPVPVDDRTIRRTLDAGGLVRMQPRRHAEDRSNPTMVASAPAFDISVVAGLRHAVAWAHDWDTGAPVRGAAAELLLERAPGETPERIARATTDADGLARFDLPEDLRLPREETHRGRWFVRMRDGSRKGAGLAILPIGPQWDGALGEARATQFWGVADKPLYRAGDVVHWKMWLREARGTTIVPVQATMPLALVDESYKVTFEFTATADAGGAMRGEFRVPLHLPDGEYCVRPNRSKEDRWRGEGGPCFAVGNYRAQDLWIRASSPTRMAREGGMLDFDVEAGYYSGGVAAGAEFADASARVEQADFAERFPRWRGFAFSDEDAHWASGGVEIDEDMTLTADASGRAHLALPVVVSPDDGGAPSPDFGDMSVTVDVRLGDREATTSNVVRVPYARYATYVGLKVDPRWPGKTGPITMQAVVATADGEAVPDAQPVRVEVFRRATATLERTRIRACTLLPGGAPFDCSFPRTESGWYDIEARSGDAAPAIVHQYIWTGAPGEPLEGDPLELEPASSKYVAGQPAAMVVKLRDAPASMLFTTWAGSELLDARVVQVDAPVLRVDIPTRADWPSYVGVTVLARPARPAGDAPAAGLRAVPRLVDARSTIRFAKGPRPAPIAIAFEPARATPGATARLTLRNTSDRARTVTLAVLDDALRALGANYDAAFDPQNDDGPAFVRGDQHPLTDGFGDRAWNNADAWRWIVDRRDADCLAAKSVHCALKLALDGPNQAHPIDVTSVESTTILTAEQLASIPIPRDVTNVALLAPGTIKSNVPRDASGLDSVEVVGAGAISPVSDPESPPAPRDRPPPRVDAPTMDPMLARVRVQFAETVLWRDDIVLAPGASQAIDVALPDNLTRWRAIAWSDDGAAAFARADATLDTGLPVEARLQAPARIYPGDTARIAANVRQVADHAAQADARLVFAADGVDEHHAATLSLAPAGQDSFGAMFAPTHPGQVALTAAAATADGRDAITMPLEVAATDIAGHRAQAGWLGTSPMALALPVLPEGASDARLHVALWRGHDAIVHEWTNALRDYPHRCWEQILSRAVAAALAIERGDPTWPEANGVVQEALDNAAVFQAYDGTMNFFPGYSGDGWGSAELTAYTVDAFALLRELGYAPPESVERRAHDALRALNRKVPADETASERDARAPDRAIAAGIEPVDAAVVDKVAASIPTLPLAARIPAVRALARSADPRTNDAVRALLDTAPQRGEARVVAFGGATGPWMTSPQREQCELIRLLQDYPQYAPPGARGQLVNGLLDLYAGGGGFVDTQTGASCLRALRAERDVATAPVAVDARLGNESHRITLAAGETRGDVTFVAPATGTLSITSTDAAASSVAYVARVDWREDARRARSNATGLSLARRYETLRGNKWVPVAGTSLREGDWVRVTLIVQTADPRFYVAVTDDLPGGLRPVDLGLAGVAGVDVVALSDQGSPAFTERKLDARKPRFYAPKLGAGRHEIHYFARVANTGAYLAAPAEVELMYGEASRARTAADRIRIADPATPAHKPR